MAHELNQPLTAILASTQTAQRVLGSGNEADDDEDLDTARRALALAAGQARRAADVLARLRRLVDRAIIVARDGDRFAAAGVPVVGDLVPDGGALGALYTAVHSAETERTLVVACDMPFVSEPLLAHLIGIGRDVDIAIPRTARGVEPLCATYSRRCAAEIRGLLNERRFRVGDVARIAALEVREVSGDELRAFGSEEVLFFNLNTPDDHARAIELAAEYHYPS
jgi:molybdopterin-guanine dinucleotide biosynthesis protein A